MATEYNLFTNTKINIMITNKDVTVNFRDYGEIVIPKGTLVTNKTACGVDENYHFVNDFGWIKKNYPEIDRMLTHDAVYYGINIPVQHIDKS